MENRFKFVKFGKNDENYQITCDLIKYRLICKEAENKSTGYKQCSDLNELNTAVDEIKNKWENLGFEFVDEGFYGNSDAMTLEMLFNIAENPKTKGIKRKKIIKMNASII